MPVSRRPTVTVFSSIADVAKSLLDTCHDIPLKILSDEALNGYGGTVEFRPSSLTQEIRSSLADAEILISEPMVVASLLRHNPKAFPRLRWCQSTYAGVDPLFSPDALGVPGTPPPPWTLTRFAGCFGPPIAEWCIARIIAHERGFAASASDEAARSWAGSREAVTGYRYLSSLTVAILGSGDIGGYIARAVKAFGARTVGFSRSPQRKDREGGCAFDEHTTDLTEALRAGDYVVSVLPSTHETRGMLGGEMLAFASKERGGKCPVFINVGRGDVIGDSNIIPALDRGYISAAILDVFETEPLPKESPLWDRSDVVVSPHVSGLTLASDVPKVFLANYERYEQCLELNYVVDWKKGY